MGSKPPVWTIYCHTHIESGRRYIGLTKKTMMQRWNNHVLCAKRKTGRGCRHFWNAIRKYGPQAFSHRVLEICSSLEEANLAEDAWIESFSARDPQFGFNLKRGGDHTPHPIKNPWDRPGFGSNSLKNLALGWIQTPAKIATLVARNKSMVLSSESRAKISESNKNRICAQETRDKLSAAGTGRKLSSEHAAKLRAMGAAHAASLKARTNCKYGHTLEDAYIRRSDGERICKTCALGRRRKAKSFISKDI